MTVKDDVTIKGLFAQFRQMETDAILWQRKVSSVRYWCLIRFSIFYIILKRMGKVSDPHPDCLVVKKR